MGRSSIRATTLQRLASRFAGLPASAIPGPVLATVKASVLDCLGVIVAARDSPPSRLLTDYLLGRMPTGTASIVGGGVRTSGEYAAWVNGTLAHALDFDDTSWPMVGHPTAPVLPTVFALAEELKLSGRHLLLALVAGIEFELWLGEQMAVPHYRMGWQPTGTLGTLGAALAGAKMLSLDAERTAMALAIAASHASGLYCNAGTMTKPLHVGNAARNGLVAAQLAARGYTGSLQAFDPPLGFTKVYSNGEARGGRGSIEKLGKEFLIEKTGLIYKLYPCCADTHRAIDALLAVRAREKIRAADVRHVYCYGSLLHQQSLPYAVPQNGFEAKFSMPYCLAAALHDGDVRLEHFDPTRGLDRRLVAFCARVTFSVHPRQRSVERYGASMNGEFQEVRVVMKDGQEFRRRVYYPRGHPKRPVTWDDLAGKFRQCVDGWLTEPEAERVITGVEKLDALDDLTGMMRVLRGAGESRDR